MSKHDFLHRGDWLDGAARYIVDHSDATGDEAAEHAIELAAELEAEHGPDPLDWPAPVDAAHSFMEDWDGADTGP